MHLKPTGTKLPETRAVWLRLVQITAPHFCAGIELAVRSKDGGYVVYRCAPILRYLEGKSWGWALSYIHTRGWRVRYLKIARNSLDAEN